MIPLNLLSIRSAISVLGLTNYVFYICKFVYVLTFYFAWALICLSARLFGWKVLLRIKIDFKNDARFIA